MGNSILLAILPLMLAMQAVAADKSVGNIKTLQPEAVISRGGVEHPAEIGDKVYSGDTLLTRGGGSLGVTFRDGSVLSLGPATEFVVEHFMFEPDIPSVSLLTRLQRGTAAYVSGAIGRIAPRAVKFKTPTATLGLRGTKVLIKVD